MWLGLSLFYVGAVLCLNGLWMLGRIADKEIWVINIFTGTVSLCIGMASIFGPSADAASVKGGALTLLFAFTYLWVAFNRFSGADGRGLGWFSLFVALTAVPVALETLSDAQSTLDWWMGINWAAWALLWALSRCPPRQSPWRTSCLAPLTRRRRAIRCRSGLIRAAARLVW